MVGEKNLVETGGAWVVKSISPQETGIRSQTKPPTKGDLKYIEYVPVLFFCFVFFWGDLLLEIVGFLYPEFRGKQSHIWAVQSQRKIRKILSSGDRSWFPLQRHVSRGIMDWD